MFLYSFLALFEEKKSWGPTLKSTFAFSLTDPRKNHFFEKNFLVNFCHFRPLEKSGFRQKFLSSAKKFAFLSTFLGRKVENFEKIFPTDFSEKSTQSGVRVNFSKNRVGKIFSIFSTFRAQKVPKNANFLSERKNSTGNPLFWGSSWGPFSDESRPVFSDFFEKVRFAGSNVRNFPLGASDVFVQFSSP